MRDLINRPIYMEQLISFREKQIIKVITGIRRCGQSTLFDLYCEYLQNDGVQKIRSSGSILKILIITIYRITYSSIIWLRID